MISHAKCIERQPWGVVQLAQLGLLLIALGGCGENSFGTGGGSPTDPAGEGPRLRLTAELSPSVAPGTTLSFTLQAVDAAAQPIPRITILGTTQAGSVDPPFGGVAGSDGRVAFRWTLPAAPGDYIISFRVRDRPDIAGLSIRITARG
jgi:hypothetical protein